MNAETEREVSARFDEIADFAHGAKWDARNPADFPRAKYQKNMANYVSGIREILERIELALDIAP